MAFKENIEGLDRVLRIGLGGAGSSLLLMLDGAQWAWLCVPVFASGVAGFCPAKAAWAALAGRARGR